MVETPVPNSRHYVKYEFKPDFRKPAVSAFLDSYLVSIAIASPNASARISTDLRESRRRNC